MLKVIGSKADIETSDETYCSLVADLLSSEIVQEMKRFNHHGNTSCFQHCLNVSYYNYKLCKVFSLNERAGARAGLLHDLFLYDWHTYKRPEGERLHGFTHAGKALENAKKYFYISDLESDIIEKHMFPLNLLSIPRYRETLIIVFTDKMCGIMEVMAYRKEVIAAMALRLFRRKSKTSE